MMKKMWKNRSGVSPVIATILMVAITVVLAAVLYVMVMGFGSNPTNNATGAIGPAQKVSDTKYTIAVTSISQNDILFTDCKVNLLSAGTSVNTTGAAVSLKATAQDLGTAYKVQYTDSDGNNKISAGDVIVLTSTTAFGPGSYELKLFGPSAQIPQSRQRADPRGVGHPEDDGRAQSRRICGQDAQ